MWCDQKNEYRQKYTHKSSHIQKKMTTTNDKMLLSSSWCGFSTKAKEQLKTNPILRMVLLTMAIFGIIPKVERYYLTVHNYAKGRELNMIYLKKNKFLAISESNTQVLLPGTFVIELYLECVDKVCE